MIRINLAVTIAIVSVILAVLSAAGVQAEDTVTVRDIVAKKDQYSAENEPNNRNGPEYDIVRSITIKSPLFQSDHTNIQERTT